MEFKIGCDPEVFVFDTSTQSYVCAEGLVPGDKQNPHKVAHGAVQVDGTALEFNIDPANTRQEFLSNISEVFDTMSEMVLNENLGYEIHTIPVADFKPKYFKTLSKKALELGCDPDWCGYTRKPNPTPKPPKGSCRRTASGHIHIGWTKDQDTSSPKYIALCSEIAKQLDWYVGYPLVFAAPNRAQESGRRILYGKAACFRPKSYGLEYRTPSNTWLRHNELIGYVYDQAQLAMKNYESGEYLPKHEDMYSMEYSLNAAYLDANYFCRFKLNSPPAIG